MTAKLHPFAEPATDAPRPAMPPAAAAAVDAAHAALSAVQTADSLRRDHAATLETYGPRIALASTRGANSCDGSDPAGMLRQALASVRLAVVALETLAALELRHPRRCAVCGDTLESGRHQLLPPMATWHAFVERDGSAS